MIFDLDNTLVESKIDYARMRRSVVSELVGMGTDPTLLDTTRTVVENIRIGKAYLAMHFPSLDAMEVDRRINRLLTSIEMERIGSARAYDGAEEAIRRIRSMGMATALLTRGSRRYALSLLELLGLDGMVGPCVCRDDYPLEEAKPNPLALIRAAGLLGLEARECLYIGDHLMDLDCAKASGAFFVGVLTGSTDAAQWRSRGCESVIATIADLPSMIEDESA